MIMNYRTDSSHVCRVAHVVTYPEPQPHPTWSYGRGAPAHGSQAPFHQRYSHYKMYGYAGMFYWLSVAHQSMCLFLC